MGLYWISFVAIVLADCAVLRWFVRPRFGRRGVVAFALLAAFADCFPIMSAAVDWLIEDNTLSFLRFAMWTYTLFVGLAVVRAVFYVFLPFARHRAAVVLGGVCAFAAGAVIVDGVTNGRKRIELRETVIRSARVPAGFDGVRIVQFSDLHTGSMVEPEAETRAVAERINALHPDMVIFSGDLVTLRYDELNDDLLNILSEIEAPLGVWSSVGNHDIGIYVKDTVSLPAAENRRLLLDREREMGWRVVDDATAYVKRGGDSISLSGVSFPSEYYESRHDSVLPATDLSNIYKGVPRELFNITVCHLPQMWGDVLDCGYGDLTLAGHFHGSQAGLRLFGARLSPAMVLHREWSGLYERDGRKLYINDGIGYVGMFLRLGTPAEITVFTLVKE